MRPVSPTVGREIVVQHEGLLGGAFQAVDELLILGGAQGRDNQRLGFATGKQRRAMGARQDAHFRRDGAHGGEVAAVDALLGVQHGVAHDMGFHVMHQAAIDVGGDFAFALADKGSAANVLAHRRCASRRACLSAIWNALVRSAMQPLSASRAPRHGRLPARPRILGGLFRQPDDGVDRACIP